MTRLPFLASLPQALDLDFLGGGRRQPWPGVLLLLVALGLCGWQLWRYQELDGLSARAEERLGAMKRKALPAVPAVEMGGEAARQLALPWDGLLRGVEAALGPDLALISLDADGATVKFAGEAAGLEEALAFVQRLQGSPVLLDPELLSHELKPVEGRQVVAFAVRSGWRGQ